MQLGGRGPRAFMTLADEPFHPDTRALLEYGRAIAAGRTPPGIKAADKLADRLFVIDGVPDGQIGRAHV